MCDANTTSCESWLKTGHDNPMARGLCCHSRKNFVKIMVKRNRKSVNSGKQSKSYEVLDSAAVSLLLGGDVKSFVKEMHPNADEASLEFYADVFSFFQIERREDTYFRIQNFLDDNHLFPTGDERMDYFITVVLNVMARSTINNK